jgi:hypothetical protein
MGNRPTPSSPAIDGSTRTRLPRGCVRNGRPNLPLDPLREIAGSVPHMPPDSQVGRPGASPPPVRKRPGGNPEHPAHVSGGEQPLHGGGIGSRLSTHTPRSHRASDISRGRLENPPPNQHAIISALVPVTLRHRDRSPIRPGSSAHTFAGFPPGTLRPIPVPRSVVLGPWRGVSVLARWRTRPTAEPWSRRQSGS